MFSYKKGDEYEIGIPLTLPIFFIGKKILMKGLQHSGDPEYLHRVFYLELVAILNQYIFLTRD